MARSFTAAPLTAEDISLAFPLVHAALPAIDLAAWHGFAEGLVGLPSPYPSGGACLRNEGGYLCGVMTYRIDRDLRHGTALNVDLFAAVDVTGEAAATRALLQVAEEKARELRCAAIRIHLEGGGERFSRRFLAAGFRPRAMLFTKPVETEPLEA